MDINKIIELGKIVKPENGYFSQVTTVGWIIISVFLFLAASYCVWVL